MGLSTNTYTYTGGPKTFSASFADGYIEKDHVKVYTPGSLNGLGEQIYLTFTWNSANEVLVSDTLTVGTLVTVERTVPKDRALVNLNAPGAITREGLSRNNRQAMHATHEIVDGRIPLLVDALAALDEYTDAASASAVSASASAVSASASAVSASASAVSAEAWAQSPTAPDPLDPNSRSAKHWAGEAASSAVTVGGPNPDVKRAMIGGAVLRSEGRLKLNVGAITGTNPATGAVVNGGTSGAKGTVFSFEAGRITLTSQLKVYWNNGETISWPGGSATVTSQTLWENIEDANHISRGFGPVDGTSNAFLVLPRTEKIHKNVVTGAQFDETFGGQFGMICGASSNLSDARITAGMPASFKFGATSTPALISGQHNSFFTHDTSVHWTLATYTLSNVTGAFTVGEVVRVGGLFGGRSAVVSYFNGTRLDIRGHNTVGYITLGTSGVVIGTTSGAYATITSETILKCWTMFHMPVYVNATPTVNYSFGAGAAFQPQTLIDICPERVSATETRFYPFGPLSVRVSFTGWEWETTGGTDRDYNGGNAWTMVWNGDHLLVTHPPVLEDWEIDLTAVGANAYTQLSASSMTTTSFRVYFRATAGGPLVVTPDANMSVYVKRGKMQLYNPWTGHVLANFQHMELDLRRVFSSAGNIWVTTTNQIN